MSKVRQWPTTRATLLSQIQDHHDEGSWQTFVDLYTPLILDYCRKRGLQHADARDVAQEVHARVSRSILNFEYDPLKGRFRSWLGLMTHQQILRLHDKDKRFQRAFGAGMGDALCDALHGEVDATWEDIFNAHIYRCACDNVCHEFDADSWTAFEQVWEQKNNPCQVAAEMGRKPQWVYQSKFNILQRIKAEIWRLSADNPIFNRRIVPRSRGVE